MKPHHVLSVATGALNVTCIFCDTCDNNPLVVFATQPEHNGPHRWHLPAHDPALVTNLNDFTNAEAILAVSTSPGLADTRSASLPITTWQAIDLCIAHMYPGEHIDLEAYGAAHTILGLDNGALHQAITCYTIAHQTQPQGETP